MIIRDPDTGLLKSISTQEYYELKNKQKEKKNALAKVMKTTKAVANFGYNVGKETALVPVRLLASPLAIGDQAIRELTKAKNKNSALQRFVFGNTEPNSKRRGYAALGLGTETAFLGLGGGAGAQAAKQVGKKALLKSVAKTAAADMGLGAGASWLYAKQEGANNKEALASAALGGTAAVVLPSAFHAGQRFLRGAYRTGGKAAAKTLDFLIEKQGKKVNRLENQLAESFYKTPELEEKITRNKLIQKTLQNIRELPYHLKIRFVDDSTPIFKKIDKAIEKK
ncbi:hypothetical protein D6827_00130, partial [Candidatus Parcubacteria bacterium]